MPSYGSISEADAFYAQRLHSWDWEAATNVDKQKALNQATELIDQFEYIGQKYAVTILGDDATCEEKRVAELSQALEFPRGDIDEVPAEIKTACYLIAKALLSGRDPELDLEHLSTRSESYGGVRATYDRNGNLQEHLAHLIPSPQAWNLIRPFLRKKKEFTINRV